MLAHRTAPIREHEDALRDVLTDYFPTRERANAVRANAEAAVARLRRDAEAQAAQIQQHSERDVAEYGEQAQSVVRRTLELGESRQAIAAATGPPVERVRAAGRPKRSSPERSGSPDGATAPIRPATGPSSAPGGSTCGSMTGVPAALP